MRSAIVASVLIACGIARAEPPPRGPHPRIFLDAATLAKLREQAKTDGTGAARAIAQCADVRDNPNEYRNSGTGFTWGSVVSSCGLAWQLRRKNEDAQTGIRYLTAMLDDDTLLGDHKGGDGVVRHDSGYWMRMFGPHAALGYDWLHDAPGMTPALRAHAAARFAAWAAWYAKDGYSHDWAGTNYEAGWLYGATLMAIAVGGEAGADGDALWNQVVEQLIRKDLLSALAPGERLDGGDWPEGWEYGPLSVLEYAMAARALEENGLKLPALVKWTGELVVRFAHATTPAGREMAVGGDTQEESHHAKLRPEPLLAVLAGHAPERAKAWARSELAKLHFDYSREGFPFYLALAQAAAGPQATFGGAGVYLARGVHTVYMRGAWARETPWAVFQCAPRMVGDHQHADAGNFLFSRGADDLIVDPAPYGTQSSMNSNAPAVDSLRLPEEYRPSQGVWGKDTRLTWVRGSTSGVVVARGDYADQWRFRETPPDIELAVRDFVFLPADADGAVVMFDHVRTGDAARGAHLRWRTPGQFALAGRMARATVGGSDVIVNLLWTSSGTPVARTPQKGEGCPAPWTRGTCDAARFAVTELAIDLKGPEAGVISVVDGVARGSAAPPAALLSGAGYRGVALARRGRSLAVIAASAPELSYSAPPGLHVVLDAPADKRGRAAVSAAKSGAECRVTVRPGGELDARPLMIRVGADCSISDDPRNTTAGPL